MGTHNIGFYEDLTKIIFELSSIIIKYAPYFFSRRRSTSFKIGNSRIPPTVRICISLIFSLIMVGFAWGFEADRIEKVQKLAYLIRLSEKCLTKKLLTSKG